MRQELNDIATAKCRPITEKFAICAKEQGLLVVFRCRQQNRDMNECLAQYTNEAQFNAYRAQKERDILQNS